MAQISGALSFIASRCLPMRTNGRTSSHGAGASITTAVPFARVRRKYLRNEASPASRRSSASPQPDRTTKSRRCAARSDIEECAPSIIARQFQRHTEMLWQERPQALRPFQQHDALGQRFLPAELVDLLRIVEPVEIEVPEAAARRVV